MKNMGFAQLRLVQPWPYTAAELSRVAHHAEDVIAQIRVCPQLGCGVGRCSLYCGYVGDCAP